MLVKKHTTEDIDLDIIGATLLSIEEVEQLPLILRKYDYWWWLRSPGEYSALAVRVYHAGAVLSYGLEVCRDDGVVRPALQIKNPKSSNLQIGDIFEFGGEEFKIISNNLAFCLSDIGTCAFRRNWKSEDANDYEKSDIKKYVDDWFNQSVQEKRLSPCKYFDEIEEKVYLTDFQKVIWFAVIGKHLDYIYTKVGRCRGTKNMERCDCNGDCSKCDFP